MSWEGRDPSTQTRCVSLEYLEELYAKADALRELLAALEETKWTFVLPLRVSAVVKKARNL